MHITVKSARMNCGEEREEGREGGREGRKEGGRKGRRDRANAEGNIDETKDRGGGGVRAEVRGQG